MEVPSEYDGRVVLIDASSIVVGTDKLNAYNDILDEAMAKLIWHHMSAL